MSTRRRIYHQVAAGETLSSIAKAENLTVPDILSYNTIKGAKFDPNKLSVGQDIYIVQGYPGSWNNPGNVEYSSQRSHAGVSGRAESNRKFLTFSDPRDGLNAMGDVIGQIVRRKIPEEFKKGRLKNDQFTVENLIRVYAPSADNNNTNEYADFVGGKLNVKPDTRLDIGNRDMMAKLLDAMVRRDTGHQHADWFTPDEYGEAASRMAARPAGAAVNQDARGGETRADAEGGDVEPIPEESVDTEESMGTEESAGPEPIPPQPSGPRIVINPSTFRNRKDALCVAFNERFRIAMEQYGFEPKSEPTPAQRRFFADTAYADDEVQLRRTILARILTLDTSIS